MDDPNYPPASATADKQPSTFEVFVPMDDILEEHAAYAKLVLSIVDPEVLPSTVRVEKPGGTV